MNFERTPMDDETGYVYAVDPVAREGIERIIQLLDGKWRRCSNPDCSHERYPNCRDKFCIYCGFPMEAMPLCECGGMLIDYYEFCPGCGKKLK